MKHQTVVAIFLTSFALGLAGNALLRQMPPGINYPLWTLAFVAVTVTMLQRARKQPWAAVLIPSLSAIAITSCVAWRDAKPLVALDTLLIVPLLALLALGPRDVRLWAAGVTRIAVALVVAAFQSAAGIFQLPFDLEWKRMPVGRASRVGGTLIRGIVIALPALFVFGALLMSADVAFATIMKKLIFIDISDVALDIVVTMLIAAACAGFLRSTLLGAPWTPPEGMEIRRFGAADMNVAVALLDALFALFVGVQLRYLFAGAPVHGMTYAEYARRGFFELVVVIMLVVPLLLAAEWIVDKRDERPLRGFRALAALQIALVLVIAASAYQRMRLYRDEFGLTELRLYTTAFMLWMAALLLWLGATVLTGRRAQFAVGVIVSGVIALVTLHAIDPEGLIVRTNAARTRPFDTRYAMTLSADATPELLRIADPCIARRVLTMDAHRSIDWRTWNLSRVRAHAAVEANRVALNALAERCPR